MIKSKKEYEYLKERVCSIYSARQDLKDKFGRNFTIDGVLAGDIGEVLAEYYYDIELSKVNTRTHDATQGKKNIQIKMTQRDSVDIAKTPEYLLVLKIVISPDKVEAYEVYNGPGSFIENEKKNSNNWKTISLKKLSLLNKNVKESQRIKKNKYENIKPWEG